VATENELKSIVENTVATCKEQARFADEAKHREAERKNGVILKHWFSGNSK
jgi:hypothetical protein